MVRGLYNGTAICIDALGVESDLATCQAEKFGDGGGNGGGGNDDIIIPYNTFSPNGDGKNEFWHIGTDVIEYPDNSVIIFNRLGEEVFRTIGYDNEDNVFNGENLSDGSYYYVVTIPSMEFSKTGYITLTR